MFFRCINSYGRARGLQPNSKSIHRRKLRDPLRFVISNSGFLSDPLRDRIWIATTTESLDKSYWYNNYLRLTDEGNIVIFDQRNGSVRWARLGFVPERLPIRDWSDISTMKHPSRCMTGNSMSSERICVAGG